MTGAASVEAKQAIAKAVMRVASDPSVAGLSMSAVAEVKAALNTELAPVIVSEHNAEAWFQSKVTLGNIGAIVTAGIGIGAAISAGVTDGQVYAGLIVAIACNAFSLYGRWVARRPIGA